MHQTEMGAETFLLMGAKQPSRLSSWTVLSLAHHSRETKRRVMLWRTRPMLFAQQCSFREILYHRMKAPQMLHLGPPINPRAWRCPGKRRIPPPQSTVVSQNLPWTAWIGKWNNRLDWSPIWS